MAHRRKVVTTDASNKGWGALCEGKPTFGLWSYKFFLPDNLGHHVLIRSDSRSMVLYINHQGGLVSKRLWHAGEQPSCVGSEQSALTEGDACAGQNEPRSRHVVKEQCLFSGMNAQPARVQIIWEIFGRARVDLFASKDNSHCPIFLQGARIPWPMNGPAFRAMLFPPSGGTNRGCRSYFQLLKAAPWLIPLRRDLLSQAMIRYGIHGPMLWALHVWLLDGRLSSSPERVLNTRFEDRIICHIIYIYNTFVHSLTQTTRLVAGFDEDPPSKNRNVL